MSELPKKFLIEFIRKLETVPAEMLGVETEELTVEVGEYPRIEYNGEKLRITLPARTSDISKFVKTAKTLADLIDNCPYPIKKGALDGDRMYIEAENGKVKLTVEITNDEYLEIWPSLTVTGTPTEIIVEVARVSGYLTKHARYEEERMFTTTIKAVEGVKCLFKIPDGKEITLVMKRDNDDIHARIRLDNKEFNLDYLDGVWRSKELEKLAPEEAAALGLCSDCSYWHEIHRDTLAESLKELKELARKLKKLPDDLKVSVYGANIIAVSKDTPGGHGYRLSNTISVIEIRNIRGVKAFLEEVRKAYDALKNVGLPLKNEIAEKLEKTLNMLSEHVEELENGKLWLANVKWKSLEYSDAGFYSFEKGSITVPLAVGELPPVFRKLIETLDGSNVSVIMNGESIELMTDGLILETKVDGNTITLSPGWYIKTGSERDFQRVKKKLHENGFKVKIENEHLLNPPVLDVEFLIGDTIRGLKPEKFVRTDNLEATYKLPENGKITIITPKRDATRIRIRLTHPFLLFGDEELVINKETHMIIVKSGDEVLEKIPLVLLNLDEK